MDHPLIHDRGRGPELIGTRITIYNLAPFFLNAATTESEIAEWNRITIEQVAAMRAYFLAHFADVMAVHEQIEERIRKGMEEQAGRFPPTPYDLRHFHDWVREREREADQGVCPFSPSPLARLREFAVLRRDWIRSHSSNGTSTCKE